MFQMPMSSPMMTTMFGFFADEVGAAGGRGRDRSGLRQQHVPGRPLRTAGGLIDALAGRSGLRRGLPCAGVGPSARDEGLKSLVAARKPSIVPSPTHASA